MMKVRWCRFDPRIIEVAHHRDLPSDAPRDTVAYVNGRWWRKQYTWIKQPEGFDPWNPPKKKKRT